MHTERYWYVLYGDAPHVFFCDDERIAEEEWRERAPMDQLQQLNRDLRDARLLLLSAGILEQV